MDAIQLIRKQATQDAQINANKNELETARPSVKGTQHASLKARLDAMEGDLTSAINGLQWKPSVANFAALKTTYPNALEGWTASTNDTNEVFRYDDATKEWLKISAISYSNATQSTAGLMSSQDKTKLDGIPAGNTILTTAGGKTITGSLTVNGGIVGSLTGNASSATKVNNDLTINVGGTSSVYNGSSAVSVNVASANHSHTGSQIPLTGYSKSNTGGAITATDNVNQAIGKLEKNLDNKANTNHTHTSQNVTALTGYTKGTTPTGGTALGTGDSLNTALSKIEHALDGKANSTHTHSYAGSTTPGGAATTAVKLQTPRTITLAGQVTGSVNFDGSQNVTIQTTVSGAVVRVNVTKTREYHTITAGTVSGFNIGISSYNATNEKALTEIFLSGVKLEDSHYEITSAGKVTPKGTAGSAWVVGDRFEVVVTRVATN